MNFASLTLTLKADPMAEENGPNWFISKVPCVVNAAGKNRVATPIELHVNGPIARQFQANAKAGMKVFVNCGTLRHDIKESKFYVMSAAVEPVGESFRNINDVILGGRCIKDLDHSDPKHVRRTTDGLLIVNQTMAVRTGENQSDLFNLCAMNAPEDRLQLARLMSECTFKGSGLTVWSRLSSRTWTDKESGAPRLSTQLQVYKMTLPPKPAKPKEQAIPAKSTISEGSEIKSLWPTTSEGGWNTATSVPPVEGFTAPPAETQQSEFQSAGAPDDSEPF